jgi:predicted enzyme related to lactoylglutathione lyase
MPPLWNSYVTVDDVDALMGDVTKLGGKVIAPLT